MDTYVQPITAAKLEAQNRLVRLIPFPNVPAPLTGIAANV
jgi:hypothetical protein